MLSPSLLDSYRPFAEEPEPVRVDRPSSWKNGFHSLRKLRQNLLSIWPERAYSGMLFQFRLLKQAYVVCNSPDSVKRVFLEEHDNYDRKSPQMRHALEPLLGDGLFVSDGELWRERREYCAPAFEAALLPAFSETMVRCAEETASDWASKENQTIDMLDEMARLTSRIIGRTIFGDATSNEEAAQVVRGFSDYQRVIEQISLADTFGLPHLRWLSNPLLKLRSIKAAGRVHEIIDRIIERRRQVTEKNTLLSLLLDGSIDKSAQKRCPLHPVAARNEAIVMFMAGHETTANTLAWAWYLLQHSPRVAAQLHEELDRVLGGRTPGLDDLPNLPYTRAVFEETMRLYPPVPLLSRQARRSDTIRDKNIEADAIVLVIPWLLHRHQKYWAYPDHFIPERFLPGQPRPDKFVYLPFSVGQRVCIGMRFGLTEGILCLATLAQRFTATLPAGHEVDIECRLTLRPSGGLPMILRKRQP